MGYESIAHEAEIQLVVYHQCCASSVKGLFWIFLKFQPLFAKIKVNYNLKSTIILIIIMVIWTKLLCRLAREKRFWKDFWDYILYTTIQPCLTCSFYQTLVLWLDEPRLHDPSLFLASLPPPYDAPRLETLLKAEMVGMFSFLIDLVAWRIWYFNLKLGSCFHRGYLLDHQDIKPPWAFTKDIAPSGTGFCGRQEGDER